MIARKLIDEWREVAPWQEDYQVEQDLVLSRALCDAYSSPLFAESLAFRGGTALNKLYLHPASRYSEDLDFVQLEAGPIGPVLNELRDALDPWLGEPRWERKVASVKLRYSYEADTTPARPMKVKIEINTREHLSALGLARLPVSVDNDWYSGRADVTTFALDELLATKLRALYQRNKGRDLYDLWRALTQLDTDAATISALFERYLERAGLTVSRAEFEANLAMKLSMDTFHRDVWPLLRNADEYDVISAAQLVLKELIARLPGDPRLGETAAV